MSGPECSWAGLLHPPGLGLDMLLGLDSDLSDGMLGLKDCLAYRFLFLVIIDFFEN